MHIVHTPLLNNHPLMHTPARFPAQRSGFSLVEVALAIAVVSFAVIGILSLMSSGLGNYRSVMDTTIAAQLAQRVINDAGQADFKVLTDVAGQKNNRDMAEAEKNGKTFSFRAPTIKDPAFRYFDEQGKEIIPRSAGKLDAKQKLSAVYWVNTRIVPRAKVPRVDGKATELAQLTVEIAANPNGIDLTDKEYIESSSSSPRHNLLKAPPGIRVLTYSAYVGRNE